MQTEALQMLVTSVILLASQHVYFHWTFQLVMLVKLLKRIFLIFASNQISTYPFIHSYIRESCLTTDPQTLRKRFPHWVGSSASSSNVHYPLVTVRSSSSCFPFLPRLPFASILPSIFPSLTCFRRQLLRKMWTIQLAFLLFTVCRTFLPSLTLRNTSF